MGLAVSAGEISVDELVAAAEGVIDRATIERHVASMGPGYATRFDPKEILRHLNLSSPRPADGEVAVDAEHEGSVTSLVVAASDRPGLLGVVAGVLALARHRRPGRTPHRERRETRPRYLLRHQRQEGRARVRPHCRSRPARSRQGAQRPTRSGRCLGPAASFPLRARQSGGTDECSLRDRRRHRRGDRRGPRIRPARIPPRRGAGDVFDEGLDVRLAKIDTRAGQVTDVFYLRSR